MDHEALSVSKTYTVAETMNLLQTQYICLRLYKTAWPFQGEPGGLHAVPVAYACGVEEFN